MEGSEIRSKLKKLYFYYTCVGSRSTFNTLTPTKFIKLFADAGVFDARLTRSSVDIIIARTCSGKKNVSFEVFCNVITRIA
jgi:hypothetical protein